MNKYKWLNIENTLVLRDLDNATIVENGNGWDGFQEYLAGGGIVDPFKTFDEWVNDALSRLWAKHDSIIAENGLSDTSKTTKQQAKLNGALRRETKGQASSNDLILLDNEDILDTWFDEMEVAAEGVDHGERWIEAPERTEQELIDYDPSLVPWPNYPL